MANRTDPVSVCPLGLPEQGRDVAEKHSQEGNGHRDRRQPGVGIREGFSVEVT